jgi:hypothetical protein
LRLSSKELDSTAISKRCRNDPIDVEAISKKQITAEGKAHADEKAEQPREVVSIFQRRATPPSTVRCLFEIASKKSVPAIDRRAVF